jgi:hypothetical protein
MKVYKSEIVFPISFENSLVAKPHHCLAPLLALAGARSGGDEGVGALVRAGSVYGFYYARIADPCYGKLCVKRVSEPVLRKRIEHLTTINQLLYPAPHWLSRRDPSY